MDILPEEVILEILLRLPVKSLLRFKCVSKSWLSLISNPHFAKLHFERYPQHTHRILYPVASEALSIDFNASLHDDSAVVRLNFPLYELTDDDDVHVMGSCRGFVLIVICGCPIFIWNPSNGVFKEIPSSCSRNYIAFLYGFGYDASTDDYLIVVASYDFAISDLGRCSTELEIFSLRANSWQKLEYHNYLYYHVMEFSDPIGGSNLEGVIHWLALCSGPAEDPYGAIIAFDLTERNLEEVPMPDMPDDFNFNFGDCELKVLGGCLSLIFLKTNGVEIWMMREYGVESSWTKHITLSFVGSDTIYVIPMCCTKDDRLVGIDGGVGLAKCTDKGELLEHREYCDDPQMYEGSPGVYTETLLSLPGSASET